MFIFLIVNNRHTITLNKEFVYMGHNFDKITNDENYVFTNYDDYYNVFHSKKIKKTDFENNNYVIISLRDNGCGEKEVTPTDYTINGNNIIVDIKYKAGCGECASMTSYYLLKVNKSITTVNVKKNYKAVNNPHCDPHVVYKPLIYLYPQKETNVVVKLGYPERLTISYPKYNKEWNVIAKPNGELIDKRGRLFYGLYWEGINYYSNDYDDGFVVSSKETSSFLEEKLSMLGLTEREANEFIIYWLPKLEENKYNLIRFESLDNINKQMPLDIKPVPDTIIRVFMKYKPLDTKIEIKEQKLFSIERKGFTVIEWGGSLIK